MNAADPMGRTILTGCTVTRGHDPRPYWVVSVEADRLHCHVLPVPQYRGAPEIVRCCDVMVSA